MTGDAECLFMCPLTMRISSLEKCQVLCFFFFWWPVSGGRAISQEKLDTFNMEKNREMNTAQKKCGFMTLPTVK